MKGSKKNAANGSRGFTLVELLVVIVIILLVSIVGASQVLPMLRSRQVTEAARILQAALVGARDAAIRANEPRGIRLMPDEMLTVPSFANATAAAPAGSQTLAYNRIVQIEPADDYSSGKMKIHPFNYAHITDGSNLEWISPYPNPTSPNYPCGFDPNNGGVAMVGTVLRVTEEPFYVYQDPVSLTQTLLPNEPTNWWWNIRVGDKLKINGTGVSYTVVGPCTVNPNSSAYPGQNPELFVNDGPPGTTSQLLVEYTVNGTPTYPHAQFLYLVNTIDDPSMSLATGIVGTNGYVNDGWDGFDNNYDNKNLVDEATPVTPSAVQGYYGEWENETWQGSLANADLTKMTNQSYTIKRRPVPVEGAREMTLPGGVVIDATTWNASTLGAGAGLTLGTERSLLPIDPNSLYVDFMVNADGQVIPQTIYSTPIAFNEPFFHFWLCDRTDVVAPQVNAAIPYLLPMPPNSPGYPASGDTSGLKLEGDRRLVSVFTKSGLITTDTLENFSATAGHDAGALHPQVINAMQPFLDAQSGIQGAR